MKTSSLALISLVLISATACSRNSQYQTGQSLAISLTKDVTAAYNSGDIKKLMNYFADDAILISCGWRMSGKDSITSGLKFILEHSSDFRISTGTATVSDDIIFIQGLMTFKWVNESYSALAKGMTILIWKKQNDGSWKITFEEENHGDLPEK